MRDGPAFYSTFWTEFRERYPDLPTLSGWKRRPEEVHQNYIGHRVERFHNIYVHLSLRPNGADLDVTVELYGADRDFPEWADAVRRVGTTGLELVEERPEGKRAIRLKHLVFSKKSPSIVRLHRLEYMEAMALVYQQVLAAVK